MVKVTPTEGAAKWQTNTKAATTYMTNGVAKVNVAPTQLAAKKLDKARANYNAAIDSGKTAAALNSVDLPTWQEAMTKKGIPRVAAGVDAAVNKTEKVFSDLYGHIQKGQDMVDKMASNTLEDSIARMTTMTRHMATFKKS